MCCTRRFLSSSTLTSSCRDEKWVRNWFTRQRSKLAARNRKGHPATADSAIVPTFKVQLCYPPPLPGDLASRRSTTPVDHHPTKPRRQPSPATLESGSPCPSRLTISAETTPSPHRRISAPVHPNNPPVNTLFSHTATMPAYSRDPLCNRYPDFSQFFRPREHERPRASTFELSTPINNYSLIMQFLANPNADPYTPMRSLGLSNLMNPLRLQLGGVPTNPVPPTYARPCPVAFSVRLVDLVDHH